MTIQTPLSSKKTKPIMHMLVLSRVKTCSSEQMHDSNI